MSINRKFYKKRTQLKKSCPVIIFESTVYPGLTEDICVKIIEDFSGLKFNELSPRGFVCGYSPERINPGDNLHRLTNIKKLLQEVLKKFRLGLMNYMDLSLKQGL